MTDQLRIRISSAAFMFGRMQVISANSTCLRNLLLQKHGVSSGPIPAKYTELGAFNEERFERIFKADDRFTTVDREVWLKISGGDDIIHRGKCDFLLASKAQSDKIVFELKSADSTNTRDNVIRKGKVAEKKSDNLAQLVTYMMASDTKMGFIIFSFYVRDDDNNTWVIKEERSFRVDILDDGNILLDRKESGFTVQDRMTHMLAQERVLKEDIIWDRPFNWDHAFASPCTYCPWQNTCTAYENGEIDSVVEFVNSAKKGLSQ